MSLLEEAWEEREETAYKTIFGDIGSGIFPLTNAVFKHLNAKSVDPRWLTQGVFKCPPTGNRTNWAYVTSGLSNPWEQESAAEYSGLGAEFMMEAAEEGVGC